MQGQVQIVDTTDSRQHMPDDRLTDLIWTPERSQHGSSRSAQVVRCPMGNCEARPDLLRSRFTVRHVEVNRLPEHFLMQQYLRLI